MPHYVRRYVPVPWSDIAPADLEPQGDPETAIETRHQTHLGLYVKGEYTAYIGMLALRCETNGMQTIPVGIAIADTPIIVEHVPVQSNPRRPRGVDVDHWREDGA